MMREFARVSAHCAFKRYPSAPLIYRRVFVDWLMFERLVFLQIPDLFHSTRRSAAELLNAIEPRIEQLSR